MLSSYHAGWKVAMERFPCLECAGVHLTGQLKMEAAKYGLLVVTHIFPLNKQVYKKNHLQS